jgi:hypothetical protein
MKPKAFWTTAESGVQAKQSVQDKARRFFGVRGHVRALKLADMSASFKAATCCRTPYLAATGAPCQFHR